MVIVEEEVAVNLPEGLSEHPVRARHTDTPRDSDTAEAG
jgi:hypothetical protein